MKTPVISLAMIFFLFQMISAQTASDLLEDGIPVKDEQLIFLQFVDETIKYELAENIEDIKKPRSVRFTNELKDSTVFMVSKDNYAIYIKPFNPLNYSCKTVVSEIADPTMKSVVLMSDLLYLNRNKQGDNNTMTPLEAKKEVVRIFGELKKLTFLNEEETIKSLDALRSAKNAVSNFYKEVNDSIYSYDFKRFEKLEEAFDLVEKTCGLASTNDWCLRLKNEPIKKGKISLVKISIRKGGYELNKRGEIVETEESDVIERVLRIRKFQRFVMEFSLGTIYTNFKYNVYGSNIDSTDQMFVAPATEKIADKLKISAMINFNYYIRNSPINPIYQIGLSYNSGIPSILTGFGLRSRIGLDKRCYLALTGGVAMVWIKELDKLAVGDKISSTTDIENDLKPKFSWPPKPYVGIQLNF